MKSISGLIKLAICIDLIITLICACVGCVSYRIFFLLVSLFGFIFEAGFYFSYLFNLTSKFSLNWPFVDFITSAVLIGLSFINFCVACAFATGRPQDGASAFFWLVAIILLCVDLYYCIRAWRGKSTRNAPQVAPGNQGAGNTNYPTYPTNTENNFQYVN
nr:Marvel [Hymenolepis microstoma]